MDLLIILTYVAFAWSVFKIFKIPVNKWTVPTAALGGIILVSGLILLMNYNHPYTGLAQKAVISVPVTPQVSGVVSEVPVHPGNRVKKGDVLFRIDDGRYRAQVYKFRADLATEMYRTDTLKAQLAESESGTEKARAERDRLLKNYQRYLNGSKAKVNPFSESDIDNARQNYLAQEALVSAAKAEEAQIQSQLKVGTGGERPQIASIRSQLAEAEYNLEQTTVRAPEDGYVTQVLVRPGTYAAALPLRPVMVFIPEQKRQIVAQFRQNALLRLNAGDEAEVVFNALPGRVLHGRLREILPVVPGGAYQAQGSVQALTDSPGMDGVLGVIELDAAADISDLPDGIYAQVAVYSDHFAHLSVMRKVLLRMTSWMHYLYLDH